MPVEQVLTLALKAQDEASNILTGMKGQTIEMIETFEKWGQKIRLVSDVTAASLAALSARLSEVVSANQKLADVTGKSFDETEGLKRVCEEANISYGAYVAMLEKVRLVQSKENDNLKTNLGEKLKQVKGIDEATLKMEEEEKILQKIAAEYKRLNDLSGQEAAMVWLKTLDVDLTEIVPLLKQGEEGIRKFQETAADHVSIIDEDDRERAEEFRIVYVKLAQALSDTATILGKILTPILIVFGKVWVWMIGIFNKFLDAVEPVITWFVKWTTIIGNVVAFIIGLLIPALYVLSGIWLYKLAVHLGSVAAAFLGLLGPIGKVAGAIAKFAIEIIAGSLHPIAGMISAFRAMGSMLKWLGGIIVANITVASSFLGFLFKWIVPIVAIVLELPKLIEFFALLGATLARLLGFETVANILYAISDAVSGLWGKLFGWAKGWFSVGEEAEKAGDKMEKASKKGAEGAEEATTALRKATEDMYSDILNQMVDLQNQAIVSLAEVLQDGKEDIQAAIGDQMDLQTGVLRDKTMMWHDKGGARVENIVKIDAKNANDMVGVTVDSFTTGEGGPSEGISAKGR